MRSAGGEGRHGSRPALVGDIGATNARFAIDRPGRPLEALRVLKCAEYRDLVSAIRAYCAATGIRRPPPCAALAVASPIYGDRVAMTNHPWSFSIRATKRALDLARFAVINDFAALALALPRLRPGERVRIGGGRAVPGTPMAVLGPGTGLGMSALVPVGAGWVPLASEGGHVTLPALTDEESRIIDHLRARFGHVSAERALSGPGLVNLYRAHARLAGRRAEALGPEDVSRRALSGECEICRRAFDTFCEMLGTVAANLALTLGARGGVFIAGGIVPEVLDTFRRSGFRRRFERKGRFSEMLAAIPVWVVTAHMPALRGLRGYFNSSLRR